jgi:hypothetical protein
MWCRTDRLTIPCLPETAHGAAEIPRWDFSGAFTALSSLIRERKGFAPAVFADLTCDHLAGFRWLEQRARCTAIDALWRVLIFSLLSRHFFCRFHPGNPQQKPRRNPLYDRSNYLSPRPACSTYNHLVSRDGPDAIPEQRLAQERAVAYRYCFGSSRQSTSTGAFAAFQVRGLSLHCLAWIADRAFNDRPSDRLRSPIIAALNEVSCIAQREHCREAWSRKIASVRWLADEASSVPVFASGRRFSHCGNCSVRLHRKVAGATSEAQRMVYFGCAPNA